jgi:SagB-type dehydrogenase family enzyme
MQYDTEISELFHENTKITPFDNGEELSDLPPPLDPGVVLARYRLPQVPFQTNGLHIEQALVQRVTARDFDPRVPLSIATLSRLLAFSCGHTTPLLESPEQPEFRRAFPSAGASYPLEIYPIVLRVAGLQAGVYHYSTQDHSLELLRPGEFGKSLAKWTLNQPYVADTSVAFVMAGFPDRITPRYGPRGYRYMLIEAGHIAQNLYLTGTSYGLGVLANGGFIDVAIDRLIGVNEINQMALYSVFVGVLKRR